MQLNRLRGNRPLTVGSLLLLIASSGCGSKELEDLAAQAKQGVEQAKQKVSEAQKSAQSLPGAVAALTKGDIKLVLDTPVNASTCAARFTPPKDGRAGLFQIGTSVSTGPKSYPAVYLHAPTEATDLQSLVGQTVQGQLFIAKAEKTGHFQSPDEKPVSVQIVKVENNVVTCQIQGAELAGIDQTQTVPVSGQMTGAIVP